jgi:hypothetical protein
MIEPADVDFEVGPYGLKKVQVNGEDWTPRVKSLQFVAEDSGVPVVNLMVVPEPFEYSGVGVVVVRDNPDTAGVIRDFLERIDPKVLEALALSKSGWGSESMGEQFLETLKEMVADD